MTPEAPDRLRRTLLAAGLAAGGASLTACSIVPLEDPSQAGIAAPTPLPRLADLRVGQRWTYAVRNSYNGEVLGREQHEVLEAGALIRIAHRDERGERPEEIQAPGLRLLQEPWWDLPVRHDDPVALCPEPLDSPAVFDASGWYHVPGNPLPLHWRQFIRPMGWHRVEVPAGRFECLRLDRKIRFRHDDPLRLESWREDRTWIAPALGRWVVREQWGGWLASRGRVPLHFSEDKLRFELLSAA